MSGHNAGKEDKCHSQRNAKEPDFTQSESDGRNCGENNDRLQRAVLEK